ncbi:MAG: helix-turn-helix domain-containing protein [Bacteroidales bacterium]|nr:helix-turn-helix domain-containing protein [Bacteroidales bacterium]
MHIGNLIKQVMDQKGISATELARLIQCNRTHIYQIQAKSTIDTSMLARLSSALDYNFFFVLSQDLKSSALVEG